MALQQWRNPVASRKEIDAVISEDQPVPEFVAEVYPEAVLKQDVYVVSNVAPRMARTVAKGSTVEIIGKVDNSEYSSFVIRHRTDDYDYAYCLVGQHLVTVTK